MAALVQAMVEILVGGLTSIATGIGQGLQSLVGAIFVTAGSNGGYTLTTFGGLILAFAGISLGIGLSKLIVNWVTSLGN